MESSMKFVKLKLSSARLCSLGIQLGDFAAEVEEKILIGLQEFHSWD
jgi:hypothetical protein